jgi:methionyl-tRNA synthetase
VRFAAYLLCPIIPQTSQAIYDQLGFTVVLQGRDAGSVSYHQHASWGVLPANQVLREPKPVFQRRELPES